MSQNKYRYKGYTAKVELDLEDQIIVGRVLGVRDRITFECESVHDIESEFHLAVDDYLKFCEEQGMSPDRPYNGNISLRLTEAMHREVAVCAEFENESINDWLIRAVEKEVRVSASRRGSGAIHTVYLVETPVSVQGAQKAKIANIRPWSRAFPNDVAPAVAEGDFTAVIQMTTRAH